MVVVKKYLLPIFLVIFFTGTRVISQIAPVNPPNNKFYINGKLKADSADVGDWVDGSGTGGFVLTNAGIPLDSTTTGLRKEPYNSNTDSSFTQGSKFNDYISSLRWGGGAPDKCDINNAMYHVSTDPGNSHQWIIIGGDRLSTSGTSYIDFEFLQNTVTPNSNGTFTGGGPHGGRTVNDRLISMEYTNGGAIAKVYIYKWKLNGSTYQWDSTGSAAIINGGTNAFARTNSANADVPFGAFGSTTYQPFAFVEAAIDITALLSAGGGNCDGLVIKTLWIKTKASASSTAALKDFINPISVSFTFGKVSIDSKDPVCVDGSPITLTGSPSGGTFSGDGVNGNIFYPDSAGVGDHVISYTASAGPSCNTTATTTITVNPLPIVVAKDTNVCTGFSVTLTATPSGGTWSGSNVSGNVFNASGVAPGSYTVTYSYTNGNGCTNSDSAIVTVNSLPTVVANDTSVCAGSSVGLTAIPGGGTWSGSHISGSTFNASGVSAGLYNAIYTYTNSNGCTKSDTAVVTVKAKPAAPTIDVVNNCDGSSTLTVTGLVNGATLYWTDDITNHDNPRTVNTSGNYYAYQVLNGCQSENGSAEASPNVTPSIATVCLVQPDLCNKYGSVVITASGGSGLLYSIDNGVHWQSSNVFDSLMSGSVTGILVQNAAGCQPIAPMDCADIVSDCGSLTIARKQDDSKTPQLENQTESVQSENTLVSHSVVTAKSATKAKDEINVTAFPVPFQNSINFRFSSPVSGKATMEIFDITGKRIAVVFDGVIKAGVMNQVQYNAGVKTTGMLIYRLKVEDKIVRGKIQQMQ
ncbi:MAG TPA: hypothetical protein VFN30_13590 [Chitinophagaceae bacterium]|nr:hypothetical protein [Chitinophagaceae bacterium]